MEPDVNTTKRFNSVDWKSLLLVWVKMHHCLRRDRQSSRRGRFEVTAASLLMENLLSLRKFSSPASTKAHRYCLWLNHPLHRGESRGRRRSACCACRTG